MAKLYALLVGIDDYPEGVRKLTGCVNDVGKWRDYLTQRFEPAALAIKELTNAEASRENVIRQFRAHLGQAGPGDVALFQYSGHGGRSTAPAEFWALQPDGLEEGLLCHDSRTPGKFDLADKELAVLIAEVAAGDAQVAVVLDCCHSGSGTRDAMETEGDVVRAGEEADYQREIGQYLDGYYLRQGTALAIPQGRHILMAACERRQKAKERGGGGIFTAVMMEVLAKSGGGLSYADLFVRCRAAVRKRAAKQDPQFEAYGRFNAQAGFLGGAAEGARRYRVVYDQGGWKVNCGAIQGAPTDPARPVGFALFGEKDGAAAGSAVTTLVGANSSALALEFQSAPGVLAYRAEMTSLPAAPLLLGCAVAGVREALAAAIAADGSVGVALAEAGADYVVVLEGDVLWVCAGEGGRRVQGVAVNAADPAGDARLLLSIMKPVAAWHRGLAVENEATKLDRGRFDVRYVQTLPDGTVREHGPGEIGLEYHRVGGEWARVRGLLQVRNRGEQELHVAMMYFSQKFEIHAWENVALGVADAADGGWKTLMGEGMNDSFSLPDGVDESVDSFKLIVSTERIDDFLLVQAPLEPGVVLGRMRNEEAAAVLPERKKVPVSNDWFTVSMAMKLERKADL